MVDRLIAPEVRSSLDNNSGESTFMQKINNLRASLLLALAAPVAGCSIPAPAPQASEESIEAAAEEIAAVKALEQEFIDRVQQEEFPIGEGSLADQNLEIALEEIVTRRALLTNQLALSGYFLESHWELKAPVKSTNRGNCLLDSSCIRIETIMTDRNGHVVYNAGGKQDEDAQYELADLTVKAKD